MFSTAPPAIPTGKFDPRKEGLERFFGPTEAMIMATLWDAPDQQIPWSVKRMHKTLRSDYEHDIAYTTVMTTMGRLFQKGIIRRKKENGAFYYAPRCTQREFEEIQLRKIIAAVGDDVIGELLGQEVTR